MKIGFTYDLKDDYINAGFTKEDAAEFDSIITIEAIEKVLTEAGHNVIKIGNIINLVNLLAKGERWDLVFNIAEGVRGVGRESQVPALLEAYGIPYTYSDSSTLTIALHKGLTKQIVKDYGIPTAEFKTIKIGESVDNINIPYPLFVKPAAEGTGKGVSSKSLVYNIHELENYVREIHEKFKQDALIENFLPGREFTVGISGTGDDATSLGVLEIIFNENAEHKYYSYENKQNYIDNVLYIMADDESSKKCNDIALAAWKSLGCLDGGRIDLKMDSNGIPNFIEVNPLAGLNPIDSDLPIICQKVGIPYKKLILDVITSAAKRYSLNV